jgi:hypothetical protein
MYIANGEEKREINGICMQTREMRFYLHSLNSSSFLPPLGCFFMMMHIASVKNISLYYAYSRVPKPFNFPFKWERIFA